MRYGSLTKRERFPDLLRDRVGTYFERDGLCFAPALETTPGGSCVMAVYFQSRYAGLADARVRLLPPRRTLWVTRHALPMPDLLFECPGGAFGVIRAPFPIRASYQGRRMTFDITADVTYPQGCGDLLRYRAGIAGGRWTLTLPEGVHQTEGDLAVPTSELIWWPALLEREATAPRIAA